MNRSTRPRRASGPDWVFSSDEDVALYRDAYSPFWGEEQELVASAAVSPTRVEEVQEVVRIANQYQIPRGFFHCTGTVCGGCVFRDLKDLEQKTGANPVPKKGLSGCLVLNRRI